MNAVIRVSDSAGAAEPVSSANIVGAAVAATPRETPEPVQSTKIGAPATNVELTADAVRLSLASNEVLTAEQVEADVQASKDAREKTKLSREDAEKLAEDLERQINTPTDTVIRFRVAAPADSADKSNFRFQVVDRDTGKVLRQFPPEDISGIKERIRDKGLGVLVDSAA